MPARTQLLRTMDALEVVSLDPMPLHNVAGFMLTTERVHIIVNASEDATWTGDEPSLWTVGAYLSTGAGGRGGAGAGRS